MTLTLTIPAPCDAGNKAQWINANHRMHWAPKAALTKNWRARARALAQVHKLPLMTRAHITATVHKTTGRAYDVANLYPTIKAVVDGLVTDYGLLPDDDNAHLTGPDMRAGEKRDVACIVLTITPLPNGPDCD